MTTYDWIVVGNGLTGSSLSYELAKQGATVLLLDQSSHPESATRFSYGGVAFWAGTTDLTRQLCREGIDRHRRLSEELDAPTEFCERQLLLPVFPEDNERVLKRLYQTFDPQPQWLDRETACELEPELNPEAIASAFVVPHGHVNPYRTVQAYNHAFQRLGGQQEIEQVEGLVRSGEAVVGVRTTATVYHSGGVIVCAGGLSRSLLHQHQIPLYSYFSHAELIETAAVDWRMNTVIMPANTRRFALEATVANEEQEMLWDQPGAEIAPPIFDAGVFQFADGHLRLGQISRLLTDPVGAVDASASETSMREALVHLVPRLSGIPGTWRRCLVAFSRDRLPLVGALPQTPGLFVFTGFSNPFAFVPPLADRLAQVLTQGGSDPIVDALTPTRF